MHSRFRTVLALAAALVALTLHGRAHAQWYMLENFAYAGKCMDNAGGSLTGGNNLVIYTCQSSVNQYFQLASDGHLIVQYGQKDANGYQYCMDYYPSNGSVGSAVKIWPCRPLSGPGDSQHWYYLGSNQFMGGSGNCVQAPSGTNATVLKMAACNTSSPPSNTRWRAK